MLDLDVEGVSADGLLRHGTLQIHVHDRALWQKPPRFGGIIQPVPCGRRLPKLGTDEPFASTPFAAAHAIPPLCRPTGLASRLHVPPEGRARHDGCVRHRFANPLILRSCARPIPEPPRIVEYRSCCPCCLPPRAFSSPWRSPSSRRAAFRRRFLRPKAARSAERFFAGSSAPLRGRSFRCRRASPGLPPVARGARRASENEEAVFSKPSVG